MEEEGVSEGRREGGRWMSWGMSLKEMEGKERGEGVKGEKDEDEVHVQQNRKGPRPYGVTAGQGSESLICLSCQITEPMEGSSSSRNFRSR